ncbi:TetR family transcriptional regulator [Gordonia caeni]|uniref:TetR/AcrR family transcriptional regulator n=1 Tax=Gordonia caeni TaxID=1007097 RepID=A0ABP7NV77_9ACTN
MGRRDEIAAAAAELLRDGDGTLTHRRVAEHARVPLGSTTYYFASLDDLTAAALEHLAAQVDADLAETAESLEAGDGTPETIAAIFHEYLSDQDRVRTETALYFAAVARPELTGLSRRWFDGMVDILSRLTDRETAQLMAVFVDGACMHAALQERPLDLPVLEGLIRTLMHRPPTSDHSEARQS